MAKAWHFSYKQSIITCLMYKDKTGYSQSKGNTFHKHAINPAEQNRK